MEDRISKLFEMFPECVTESRDRNGKLRHVIDFDVLRQLLGDQIPDDVPEAYRFDWVGKTSARIEAYRRIEKTLRPDLESSLNFESTQNLYIEGDNLDALKLLQKSYYKKIKLIYIDPPYNTGHDFIYRDQFEMDEEEYSDRVDLYDEDGNLNFVENSDSNPRFHSDWCSMIYSRLLLARNLLSDDGVIFISIDDNEQSNLKKICDEVLGSRNFIAQIIWERAYAPVNLKKHFSTSHDYILCYAKNISVTVCNGLPRSEKADSMYSNPNNDPRGLWRTCSLAVGPAVEKNIYEITGPTGNKFLPPSGYSWRLSRERYEEYLAEDRIFFADNGNGVPSMKKFLSEVKQQMTPMTIWKYTEVGHSQDATKSLKEIFDGKLVFTYPKPVDLIKRCLELYSDPDSIILDFFSGSSTTAHAVMQLNFEDNGNRKFIMIQLPEICPENSEAFKSGFKNICEIGKERIRRSGKNFENIDRGFRVLKLDSTNFRDVLISPDELTREKLLDLLENIKSDRSPLDLLFECLINWGVELNLKLEIEKFEGFTILNYNSGDLIACFDKNLPRKVIEFMANKNANRVVFRDESFSSDSDKINSIEFFKLYSPNTRFKVI